MTPEIDETFLRHADIFIQEANALAKIMSPSEVGDIMLYATARYMAFLIHEQAVTSRQSPQQLTEECLAAMERAVMHHLVQMPHPNAPSPLQQAPVASDLMKNVATTEDQIRAVKAMEVIQRSFGALDVTVAAYLRGAGEQDAAELVSKAIVSEDDPLHQFCWAVYQAWNSGLLPEPIAVCALMQTCTQILLMHSPDGYVKEPAKDLETKKRFEQLFSDFGLHKLNTILRKAPERLEELSATGMALLFGDSALDLINSLKAMRRGS